MRRDLINLYISIAYKCILFRGGGHGFAGLPFGVTAFDFVWVVGGFLAPAVDLLVVDLLVVDLLVVDLPAVDLLSADLLAVDLFSADLPAVDLPAVDLLAVDLLAVDLLAVDLLSADLPAVDDPRFAAFAGVVDSMGDFVAR